MRGSAFATLVLALGVSASACSDRTEGGVDAGGTDLGIVDGGGLDAQLADLGQPDASQDMIVVDSATADMSTLDSGTTDLGVADANTADGPSDPTFVAEIRDATAYGNCFGAVGDPLLVFWTAHVVGDPGQTITVTEAKLTVASSVEEEQTLSVDVDHFEIPSGGTVDQEMRKTSGTPSIAICTYCDMSLSGGLSVTFTSSTGSHSTEIVDIVGLGCVF